MMTQYLFLTELILQIGYSCGQQKNYSIYIVVLLFAYILRNTNEKVSILWGWLELHIVIFTVIEYKNMQKKSYKKEREIYKYLRHRMIAWYVILDVKLVDYNSKNPRLKIPFKPFGISSHPRQIQALYHIDSIIKDIF